MSSGTEDKEYNHLFENTERGTDVPSFEDVLNFTKPQRNYSGIPFKVMLILFLLSIGFYFYLKKPPVAGNLNKETAQLWEWKSPTQNLLSSALANTFTNLNLPTDVLTPVKISSPINNQINQ